MERKTVLFIALACIMSFLSIDTQAWRKDSDSHWGHKSNHKSGLMSGRKRSKWSHKNQGRRSGGWGRNKNNGRNNVLERTSNAIGNAVDETAHAGARAAETVMP